MGPRTERRARGGVKSLRGVSAQASSADIELLGAAAPSSPRDSSELKNQGSSSQGFSILREFFPEHAADGESCKGKAPQLQQLLGGVPSPARAKFGNTSNQSNGEPFGPPTHSPLPLVAPAMPPPPPLLAPACQERWDVPAAAPEQAFGSYRDRLRAGGQGAFQRAFDAGFVPRSMKQEWGGMHMPPAASHGELLQQEMQSGAAMSYTGAGDCNQMWSGAGHMQSDSWGGPMQTQYQCVQQAPQFETQGLQMVPPVSMQSQQMPMQMLPQMAVQQPMQMMPMAQGEQSPQMSQMYMSQMPVQQMPQPQMQLPQMAMSQAPPTASGESTPTGMQTPAESVRSECMAILMPQASQFHCDSDMLAAQLQASADCQRYED